MKHPRDSDATSSTAAGDDEIDQLRPLRSAVETHRTKTEKETVGNYRRLTGVAEPGLPSVDLSALLPAVETESTGGALAC